LLARLPPRDKRQGGKSIKSNPPSMGTKWRGNLTVAMILAWADAFDERTGRWPTTKSGRIPGGKNARPERR